ncbi:MAG TPA: ABC transporter substrate-binding protein, partial [Microlunatus sp.]
MSQAVNRRRFLSGSLGIAALAAGGTGLLSGCSSSSSTTAGSGSGATGTPPTYVHYDGVKPDLAGTEAGVPDAFYHYPEKPVSAFDKAPGDGKPITAMAQTSEPIPPAMGSNPYWQELNKQLGSELKIAMTTATDYDAKFATVVAGGDELPDIFQVSRGATAVPQLMASKALDLTEYLSGDAAKDYPYLANIPSASWKHAMFDGKIYAVPIPRGALQSTIIYRRDDLLSKLGIDTEPSDFSDFFDLCKEITNPKKNVWALSQAPTNYVMQMLKVPNGWAEEGGKLTSKWESPQIKDALDASRKTVEAGVIAPDSFAANANQYKQWFMSGTTYLTGDSYSAWPAYYAQSTSVKDFALSAMGFPGFDGGKGSIWLRSPTHSIVGINKESADRAKTLLSVMNWLAAPFGTEEYLFRKYGIANRNYKLEGTDPVQDQGKVGETFLGIQYLADAPPVLYLPGAEDTIKGQYEQMKSVIPDGTPDPTEGLYSETNTRIGGKIGEKLDT